jgi:hypothetical protein
MIGLEQRRSPATGARAAGLVVELALPDDLPEAARGHVQELLGACVSRAARRG